jgi:hypothetical protein
MASSSSVSKSGDKPTKQRTSSAQSTTSDDADIPQSRFAHQTKFDSLSGLNTNGRGGSLGDPKPHNTMRQPAPGTSTYNIGDRSQVTSHTLQTGRNRKNNRNMYVFSKPDSVAASRKKALGMTTSDATPEFTRESDPEPQHILSDLDRKFSERIKDLDKTADWQDMLSVPRPPNWQWRDACFKKEIFTTEAFKNPTDEQLGDLAFVKQMMANKDAQIAELKAAGTTQNWSKSQQDRSIDAFIKRDQYRNSLDAHAALEISRYKDETMILATLLQKIEHLRSPVKDIQDRLDALSKARLRLDKEGYKDYDLGHQLKQMRDIVDKKGVSGHSQAEINEIFKTSGEAYMLYAQQAKVNTLIEELTSTMQTIIAIANVDRLRDTIQQGIDKLQKAYKEDFSSPASMYVDTRCLTLGYYHGHMDRQNLERYAKGDKKRHQSQIDQNDLRDSDIWYGFKSCETAAQAQIHQLLDGLPPHKVREIFECIGWHRSASYHARVQRSQELLEEQQADRALPEGQRKGIDNSLRRARVLTPAMTEYNDQMAKRYGQLVATFGGDAGMSTVPGWQYHIGTTLDAVYHYAADRATWRQKTPSGYFRTVADSFAAATDNQKTLSEYQPRPFKVDQAFVLECDQRMYGRGRNGQLEPPKMYEKTLPPQKSGSRKKAAQSHRETRPEILPQTQSQLQEQHQQAAYQYGYGQLQAQQQQAAYQYGYGQPQAHGYYSLEQPLSPWGDIEDMHSESPYPNDPSHGW